MLQFYRLLAFLFAVISSVSRAETTVQSFSNYEELQKTMTELVASAKQRVWVVSRALDAHLISDALFFAQHRKVDVKLLLGPIGVQSTNGRALLNFFASQKIFYMLDSKLRVESTSAFLVDDRLVWANTVFSERKSEAPYSLQWIQSRDKTDAFRKYFEDHLLSMNKTKEWDTLPSVFEYKKRPTEVSPYSSRSLPRHLKSESH